MLRLSGNVRTVWVGDLKVENKIGADGNAFQHKTIHFKVASNRDYSITKVVNGQAVKERPSDFVLCRATGNLAQVIADYASAKNTEGKTISRFVSLHGALETFMGQKTINIEKIVAINGVNYRVPFSETINVEQSVFVVKDIEFLDSGNKVEAVTTTNTNAQVVQATPVEGTVDSASVVNVQQSVVNQTVVTTPPAQQPVVEQTVVATLPVEQTVVTENTQSVEQPVENTTTDNNIEPVQEQTNPGEIPF